MQKQLGKLSGALDPSLGMTPKWQSKHNPVLNLIMHGLGAGWCGEEVLHLSLSPDHLKHLMHKVSETSVLPPSRFGVHMNIRLLIHVLKPDSMWFLKQCHFSETTSPYPTAKVNVTHFGVSEKSENEKWLKTVSSHYKCLVNVMVWMSKLLGNRDSLSVPWRDVDLQCQCCSSHNLADQCHAWY